MLVQPVFTVPTPNSQPLHLIFMVTNVQQVVSTVCKLSFLVDQSDSATSSPLVMQGRTIRVNEAQPPGSGGGGRGGYGGGGRGGGGGYGGGEFEPGPAWMQHQLLCVCAPCLAAAS